MEQTFKRMNFFQGFFTQAEDWQADQTYHVEKRRLHSAHFHTAGIVPGCLKEFDVEASNDGTAFLVRPGYGIDGEGRDLYLPDATELQLVPQDYKLPCTVYVTARYNEEKIDLRPNATNPMYTGHAFTQETPILEITKETPDNHLQLELARVELSKDAQRIKDPASPNNPDKNEIDHRHIHKAGSLPGRVTVSHLGTLVRDGELRVAATPETAPSTSDPNVLIEQIKGTTDAHRHYMVSAYPVEDGRITWRIESTYEQGKVEYRLFFKNFAERATRVFYQVHKCHT